MNDSRNAGEATAAQVALDKIEAAETVARFYGALERYHCLGLDWDLLETVIADQMIYLSPNFRDETPRPRPEFLTWFNEIQSVHARPRRGSVYHMSHPVVDVDGDTAHVHCHLIMSHWLSPESEHSTWFYAEVDIDLIRGVSGWQITRYSPEIVRTEGYSPAVNHLAPDLPVPSH